MSWRTRYDWDKLAGGMDDKLWALLRMRYDDVRKHCQSLNGT
jgi:hypothetical protein